MANRVTVNICGEDYTLVAEENTAYMEQVAALVDKKMGEVIAGAKVGRSDAAVLAAVNLADELLKSEQAAENLRRQVKGYLDEAAQARGEISDLKRQLFKAQQGKKRGLWSCSPPPGPMRPCWPPCKTGPTLYTWAWAALTPAAAPEILRMRTSPGPWTTVTSAE